jgi:hypothetical protein
MRRVSSRTFIATEIETFGYHGGEYELSVELVPHDNIGVDIDGIAFTIDMNALSRDLHTELAFRG